MAKKISRNSRAARNGEACEPEAKSLEQLPRAEKTNLTNVLLRTTAKNEALLEAKLHKKSKNKISKKRSSTLSNSLDAGKVERALNITSRLDGKIAKSINRAKYIQTARKAGWDSTNDKIKKELATLHNEESNTETKKADELEEDIIEDTDNGGNSKQGSEGSQDSTPKNVFSLLKDDVEV